MTSDEEVVEGVVVVEVAVEAVKGVVVLEEIKPMLPSQMHLLRLIMVRPPVLPQLLLLHLQ